MKACDDMTRKRPIVIDLLMDAAAKGKLPAGFRRWEIADRTGWSVAHEAAFHGPMPDDFNQWNLADADGLTVAHVAATFDHLPPTFDHEKHGTADMIRYGQAIIK